MSGVANMAAGITSLNRLRGAIKALPLRIRTAVAKDAEAILTREVQDAYDGGQTVYGVARPLSKVTGQPLTLQKTGATRRDLSFVAVGTIVRAVLGRKYQRYLVGKYQVLPSGLLPAVWREKIEKVVHEFAEDFEREALR